MKNFKEKVIGICVILGFSVLAFVCLLFIANEASGQYETKDIYVASKDIPRFTKITESNFDSFFELKKDINVSIIDDDTLMDKEDVLEKYVTEDIRKLSTISVKQFMKEKDILSEFTNPYECSISVNSFSDAASGTIREGDYVRLYAYDASISDVISVSDKVYFVCAAFDNSGTRILPGDTTSVATSFNFLIEESEEQELYSNTYDKKVILVKEK